MPAKRKPKKKQVEDDDAPKIIPPSEIKALATALLQVDRHMERFPDIYYTRFVASKNKKETA
jgi:hypothetical protein